MITSLFPYSWDRSADVLLLHPCPARRGGRADLVRPHQPGGQPRGQRGRPVRGPHPQLLHDAPGGDWASTSAASTSRTGWPPRACQSPCPSQAPPAPFTFSCTDLRDSCLELQSQATVVGQRRAGRREVAGHHHQCQLGRQIHVPAQRRRGPAHDAMRAVRHRAVLPGERDPRDLHPLHPGGRYRHDQRAAGRRAAPDERHRRPDRPALPHAVQRVLRRDQRARGIRDRPPGRQRPAGRAASRCSSSPTGSASPTLPPPAARTPPCSCEPSASPTDAATTSSP